ncbi:hypothetical protein FIU88_14360 [Halomonas sp. THAF12]|uniref:hypothetical protein n=1 Tax=Halomonas sp. THAF12 TaxID=2587849 RepID=UPI0012AAA5B7|nr:hypothetical protein [Halomonas sp. THAF12]QFT86145.1 hypothetical protein FIU88_14360 [Halomonas sp. THAF12]
MDAHGEQQPEGGVVGVRIRLETLEGTAKLGQHRSREDRAGVLAGLGASDDPLSRRLGRYAECHAQGMCETE